MSDRPMNCEFCGKEPTCGTGRTGHTLWYACVTPGCPVSGQESTLETWNTRRGPAHETIKKTAQTCRILARHWEEYTDPERRQTILRIAQTIDPANVDGTVGDAAAAIRALGEEGV